VRFGGRPGPLSVLAGAFSKHLPEKFAALLLAVLVWFTIRQELTDSVTVAVTVKADLPPKLILVDGFRPFSKAVFRGPRAQIEALKKLEPIVITLRVREEDLVGQEQAAMSFSVERGNLSHEYGPDVKITSTDPPIPVELKVALLSEKAVTVNLPRVMGLVGEWESKVELLTPTVRIAGPAPALKDLTAVDAEPIDGADILGRRGTREDVEKLPLERKLSSIERARRLSLAEGESIKCQVTLTRSRISREFAVPFSVLFERHDWPVTLVPNETDLLKRDGTGFRIRLTFTGTSLDLEQVAQAVAGGQIRAFVFAEDCEAYRDQEEDRGYLEPVRLEMPDALRRRVSFSPPPRESIEVDTKKH
jgi:hypothetical protein